MILKLVFFGLHILYIFITIILPFFYIFALILPIVTILTWYFNNNKCLITQTEKYLFDETIIEFYYKSTNQNNKKTGFIVPKSQRYTVIIIFLIQIIFNINNFNELLFKIQEI